MRWERLWRRNGIGPEDTEQICRVSIKKEERAWRKGNQWDPAKKNPQSG